MPRCSRHGKRWEDLYIPKMERIPCWTSGAASSALEPRIPHLENLLVSVLIRISFRQQMCYPGPFLYDDAHDTIGCGSRLEALSSGLTNHSSLATRHRISNRHTAQFKS